MIQIIAASFTVLVLSTFALKSSAQTIRIMSYNVENLFDTKHDLNKNDYSYLPLAKKKNSQVIQNFCSNIPIPYYRESCFNLDWSDEVLSKKIENIAKVIKSQNADIVILQEVENINVLKELTAKGLKGLKYTSVILLEGPDSRGIDIGIISKFPLYKNPKLLYVNTPSVDNNGVPDKETRGILKASFKITGKVLTIFGNHWPSQSHPDQSRLVAGKTLYNAIDAKDDLVISAGDFNTVKDDQRSGIEEYLLNSSRKYSFIDAEENFFLLNPQSELKKGTHYHRGNWGSLDHIFVLDNTKKVKPLWNSFKVVKLDFMLKKNKRNDFVPFRFDPKNKMGYSDHLPVVMNFEF